MYYHATGEVARFDPASETRCCVCWPVTLATSVLLPRKTQARQNQPKALDWKVVHDTTALTRKGKSSVCSFVSVGESISIFLNQTNACQITSTLNNFWTIFSPVFCVLDKTSMVP